MNYDNIAATDTPGWDRAKRRMGAQVVRVSKIFRSVFGDAAMMTRVRPVLMTQLGDTDGWLNPALSFVENYYNNGDGNHVPDPRPVSYYIYGVGGSAYYGPDVNSSTLTVESIFQNFFTPYFQTTEPIKDVDWAASFGVKRIAYEGGPGMDNTGNSEFAKETAWNDSRMRDVLRFKHDDWSASGGDLLMYFCSTGDYQWGFTKDSYDLTHPKYQGILDIVASPRAAITYGPVPPVTFKGGEWRVTYGWRSRNDSQTLNPGQFVGYTFRTTTSGTSYDIICNTGGSGTFLVYVDDRLLGTVNVANGDTVAVRTPALEAGLHGVRLRAQSAMTLNTVRVVNPGGGTPPPSGTGTGLRGQYFANVSLQGTPAVTRTDTAVDFDLGTGSYTSGGPTDNFSARWEGEVQATVAGNYRFHTVSDDGVRLWINGNLVIDNWTDHAPVTDTSGLISLTAGQKVPVKMEFYERGGGAVARLQWTPPGGAQGAIPQTQLYPASGSGPASGSLTGSVASAGTAVNLTTQGTSDWVQVGHSSNTSVNRKSSGNGQITIALPSGTSRYADNAVAFTWTDGTPTSGATNSTTGVYVNSGTFTLTVPASTTTRTLKLYVGGWSSTGQLTATLSDGSATAYTDTQSSSGGNYYRVYTLTYKAGSASQTMTVTWQKTAGNGNITLQAATLQ